MELTTTKRTRHLIYPAAGILEDVEKLLHQFENCGSLRFTQFSALWRKMNFICIHAGRIGMREKREFVEETFKVILKYAFYPFTLQVRVGALYVLYSIFITQRCQPEVCIRIPLPQWAELLEMHKELIASGHTDADYIFRKMRYDHQAFHFVVYADLQTHEDFYESDEDGNHYEDLDIFHRNVKVIDDHLLATTRQLLDEYVKVKSAHIQSKKDAGSRNAHVSLDAVVAKDAQKLRRVHGNNPSTSLARPRRFAQLSTHSSKDSPEQQFEAMDSDQLEEMVNEQFDQQISHEIKYLESESETEYAAPPPARFTIEKKRMVTTRSKKKVLNTSKIVTKAQQIRMKALSTPVQSYVAKKFGDRPAKSSANKNKKPSENPKEKVKTRKKKKRRRIGDRSFNTTLNKTADLDETVNATFDEINETILDYSVVSEPDEESSEEEEYKPSTDDENVTRYYRFGQMKRLPAKRKKKKRQKKLVK